MKKHLWLSLCLLLSALSGDGFAGDEVYVSRRYPLSVFRQAVRPDIQSKGSLNSFGLTAPRTGLREFNVDDECGLEECLEQQIPEDNWSTKQVELIYSDDEVRIHQNPRVHKKIEALFERLSTALLRPMRLEIRRYEYQKKDAVQFIKVGAPLSVKQFQVLEGLIQNKSARLLTRETISLRDGEIREISNTTGRAVLYNDTNEFDGAGAESIQLRTGQTTTVTALRSRDGRFIDLKMLFEKADLKQISNEVHGSFFLQKPTVQREYLEAGLRLTWHKPYVIMKNCQGERGQFVVVQMKKCRGLPESKTMEVLPIYVLDDRWDLPRPRSPWSGMRLGPTTPMNGKDKTSKLDSRFLDRLPEQHVYAMSGLVYLAREDESTLRSDCQKRFDARRVLLAQASTGARDSSESSKSRGGLQQWSLLSDQALRFGQVTETLCFTGLTRHPRLLGIRQWAELKLHVNPLATGFSVCLLPERTRKKTHFAGVVEAGRNQSSGLTLWGAQRVFPFQLDSNIFKLTASSKTPASFTFDQRNQQTTHVQLIEKDEAK